MKEEKPIGVYFKIISTTLDEYKNRQLEKLNLTSAQGNVLMFLVCNKDKMINQRDIENRFNLSNPTVNGILNRLETKKLIIRVKNIDDARIREIHVTERVQKLEKEMIDKMINTEKNMLSVLSEEEQEELRKLLKKIVNNIIKNKGGKNETNI